CLRYLVSYEMLTLFIFKDMATTETYTLSLHDALPILVARNRAEGDLIEVVPDALRIPDIPRRVLDHSGHVQIESAPQRDELRPRSEEHTSELQSRRDLVCRLLLEKKNPNPG